VHVDNTKTAKSSKNFRMQKAQEAGFVEIGSSYSRIVLNYFAKNLKNVLDYNSFLESVKLGLLKLTVANNHIKLYLKLEATYHRINVENSSENRTFKTSTRAIFLD